MKKNIPIDSAAIRYISAQPIVFISENGEKRPNKRKLNELPYIISKFEPNNSAIQAATHCFMNYNFMYYKFLISDIIFLFQIGDLCSQKNQNHYLYFSYILL